MKPCFLLAPERAMQFSESQRTEELLSGAPPFCGSGDGKGLRLRMIAEVTFTLKKETRRGGQK